MSRRTFKLVVVQGPDEGQQWMVEPGQPVTVGRGDWVEIRLEHDESISREHFRLAFVDRAWVVTNLSRNGTCVNGQFVSEVPIQAGDELSIGNDTVISFTEVQERDHPEAAEGAESVSTTLPDEAQPDQSQSADGVPDDDSASEIEGQPEPAVTAEITPPVPGGQLAAGNLQKLCALWVVQGASAGHSVPLTSDLSTTVGRDPACTLTIPDDDAVSRRHCEILAVDAGYELRNYSQNGTLVNGSLVDAAPLHDGDEIRLGNHTVLRVSLAEPESVTDSPAESDITPVRLERETGIIQWTVPLTETSRTSAADVIARLEEHAAAYLVLDFTRAGLERGDRFPNAGVLLPYLVGEDLPELSPVVIPVAEVAEEWGELVQQAWAKDALLIIFTETPFDELVAQLQQLAHYDPIHDRLGNENGVFGFWYPALLYQLLTVGQPHVSERLLSGLQAVAVEGIQPEEVCIFTKPDFDTIVSSALTAVSETA